MVRPSRIELSGAQYHITSRGDRRENIFVDDASRLTPLRIRAEVVDRFNWLCHAYYLMSNHDHLLVETPDGNLSKGMRQLNGVYTHASTQHIETATPSLRCDTRRHWAGQPGSRRSDCRRQRDGC